MSSSSSASPMTHSCATYPISSGTLTTVSSTSQPALPLPPSSTSRSLGSDVPLTTLSSGTVTVAVEVSLAAPMASVTEMPKSTDIPKSMVAVTALPPLSTSVSRPRVTSPIAVPQVSAWCDSLLPRLLTLSVFLDCRYSRRCCCFRFSDWHCFECADDTFCY